MARADVSVIVLLSFVCLLPQIRGQDNREKASKNPVRIGNLDSSEGKAEASESKSQIQPLFSLSMGGTIPGVRFSPCSRYIAYWTFNITGWGLSQSKLRVRELLTGKECFSFGGSFTNFQFSHDGERVVICENGNIVSLWKVENGNHLAKLKRSDLAWFLREGEVLATRRTFDDVPDKPKTIKLQLWDTRSWTEIPSKLDKFSLSSTPLITRDARFAAALVSGGKEQASSLKIWEIDTGEELTSPDITNPLQIALANSTHAIRVKSTDRWFDWNFDTENLVECEAPIFNLFDPLDSSDSLNRPDARIGRVQLVDGNWQIVGNGRIIKTFPNPTSWRPTQSNHKELINDDQLLLTQEESGGEINVWTLEQPNQPWTIPFETTVKDLTLAGDGRTLAVLSASNSNKIQTMQDPTRVTLVDLQQETQPKILTEGRVVDISFADKSQLLAVVFPDKVELWNTAECSTISVHRITEHVQYLENSMAEVSSSALQIVIAANRFIELRNIADDRIQWKTEVGWVNKIKMSKDGRYIAASADSNTNHPKICVLSASDGRILSCGGTDHPADLFQFWSNRQVLTIVRQEEQVTQIDLSSKFDIARFQAGKSIDHSGTNRYGDSFAASAPTGQYAVASAVAGWSDDHGEVRIRDIVSGKLQFKLTAATGR